MSRIQRARMEDALSEAVTLQMELSAMTGRLSALTDFLSGASSSDQ